MGFPFILITLVPNIYVFYVLMCTHGIGAGCVSTAVNTFGLEIWRGHGKGGPAMYAIDFGFAFGAMIGPLLAGQALQLKEGDIQAIVLNYCSYCI